LEDVPQRIESRGVDPHYEFLNGRAIDPETPIWSLNVQRREMVKGQIAIIARHLRRLPPGVDKAERRPLRCV
jgi:hypothetical protein